MKLFLIGNSLLNLLSEIGNIYINIFWLISFSIFHILVSTLYTIFLMTAIRNFMYSYWLISHSLESTLLYICANFLHSLDFINSIIIQHINSYCRREPSSHRYGTISLKSKFRHFLHCGRYTNCYRTQYAIICKVRALLKVFIFLFKTLQIARLYYIIIPFGI